ncbi:MAG: MFS transporter [Candidatus Anstonellales archaeon]
MKEVHKLTWAFWALEKDKIIDIIILIRVLSISLVSIFLPAYFLKDFSIDAFIYYFAGYALAGLTAVYSISYLVKSKMNDKAMLISVLCFALGMIFMQQKSYAAIFIASFLLAVAERAFWIPFHYIYSLTVDKKEKAYAIINSIVYLAPFLSPLIGLLIVDFFGFDSLFTFALIFYSLNIILYKFTNLKIRKKFNIKPVLRFDGLYFADVLKTNVLGLIWPTMLLIFGWELKDIIFLFSVCYLISGLISLFNAQYLNAKIRTTLSPKLAFVHSLSILLRAFPAPLINGISALIGFSANVIFDSHYMAYFYSRAKNNISEVINRELNIAFGYIFLFLSSFIFSIFTYETFVFLMLLTAIGSMYVSVFFTKHEYKE